MDNKPFTAGANPSERYQLEKHLVRFKHHIMRRRFSPRISD